MSERSVKRVERDVIKLIIWFAITKFLDLFNVCYVKEHNILESGSLV